MIAGSVASAERAQSPMKGPAPFGYSGLACLEGARSTSSRHAGLSAGYLERARSTPSGHGFHRLFLRLPPWSRMNHQFELSFDISFRSMIDRISVDFIKCQTANGRAGRSRRQSWRRGAVA